MKQVSKILPYVFTISLFAVGFYVVTNVRDIIDWWRLRDYTASAQIESLADTSGMSSVARRLFYVHDPVVLDKASFREKCTVDEETIVLGCYITHQRIYIYDVQDDRLAGVEEVTAAHEMLHAAYDRLTPKEKEHLARLLDDAFSRISDQRIIENIATYRSKDASVVHNEMHSILGTEVRQLPQELEAHYKKYFTDRLKVVTKAEQYASEFQAREDRIATYDEELSQMNGEISRLQADLKDMSTNLAQEREIVESLRGNPKEFNAAVSTYNSHVSSYNSLVNQVKVKIDAYNTMIVERNAIAFEERELVEAIDTRIDSL
jgi:predicted  nucleic acid-binding Zn-ribbon protein